MRHTTTRMSALLATMAGIGLVASAVAPAQASIGGHNSYQGATVRMWTFGQKATNRLCSGSHIGNGWVLTAKHCIDTAGVNTKLTKVVWGNPAIDWDAPSSSFSGPSSGVDKIVSHPDTKKDMALIHVPGLAQANAPTYSLREGGRAEDLKGARCTAYGYGLWEDESQGAAALPRHQRGLDFEIKEAHTSIKTSAASQLRGYSNNNGYLNTGDSGGSLICNGKLSGVTVAYTQKSNSNTFMSISSPERKWIRKVAGI